MIIYPPKADFRDIDHGKQIVFLAGPIQGAPNRQQEAINLISNTDAFKENKVVMYDARKVGELPTFLKRYTE